MCGVGWGGINRVSRGKGEGFFVLGGGVGKGKAFCFGWGVIGYLVTEFLGIKVFAWEILVFNSLVDSICADHINKRILLTVSTYLG